jgi:hypothetical protein
VSARFRKERPLKLPGNIGRGHDHGDPIQVSNSVDLENKASPTMSAAPSTLCARQPVHSEERAILFDFGTKAWAEPAHVQHLFYGLQPARASPTAGEALERIAALSGPSALRSARSCDRRLVIEAVADEAGSRTFELAIS